MLAGAEQKEIVFPVPQKKILSARLRIKSEAAEEGIVWRQMRRVVEGV